MKRYDIVVIGGGPAGMVTAMTAKKLHGDKSVLMIKESAKGVVPCGIPYVFHELGDVDKNVMGPKGFVDMGGEVLIDRVASVDVEVKAVKVSSGEQIGYDKLVFATGSRPMTASFITGHDLVDGVGYVGKSYESIAALKEKTDKVNKIIVLGSGFTAVELAEQFAKDEGKQVKLVYRASHCLKRSFSDYIAEKVDKSLSDAGVVLHSRSQVSEIIDEGGRACGIKLDDGSVIEGDFVIIGMGYMPNSELAMEAGIAVNKYGGIVVDNYLRTNMEDVFAVGDCAGTVGFITGQTSQIMLASTGAAEARILGYNLYSMRIKRNFGGTLSVFSTELNGTSYASAGVTQSQAEAAGIDYVVGGFEDIDRHPGSLSCVSSIGAKLIVSSGDGQILGGELFGGKSIGEMVNTLALAIQKNVTVYEMISFQLGTHPLLTGAPTKPLLVKAAENAIEQIS